MRNESCMITNDDQLSSWIKMNHWNCIKKRSCRPFGCHKPVWLITVFWNRVRRLQWKYTFVKSMKCIKKLQRNWSVLIFRKGPMLYSTTLAWTFQKWLCKNWMSLNTKICLIHLIHQTLRQRISISSNISATSYSRNASKTKMILKRPSTNSLTPELLIFTLLELIN